MTPKDVLTLIKRKQIKSVDVRFTDTPGTWQHFSIPATELEEDSFKAGLGFDGSSIRGWRAIESSDMLAVPDPDTAFVDPFSSVPTLCLTCYIIDPVTREDYNRDPRNVARRAEKYLKSSGFGDTAYFGPEPEFFVFDEVRYEQTQNSSMHLVDSAEANWNMGRAENPNLGHKIRPKEGYFPVAPADTQQDLREEMVAEMIACGIAVERQHHEVATGGQAEIDMRFDSLVRMADKVMLYKYIVKNVARRHGKTATFMPKPIFQDNGSGMHTHQSIWKGGKPLFAGKGYAGLSETALHYIGGLLKHAPALCAFCSPTWNSYKRLVPGYEAPVNLCYSARNRSAACRIPLYSPSPKAKRVEYRPPDPTANPYFAFAAMLMAGLDGIKRKINPGEPLDKSSYELTPAEAKKVPSVPGTLHDALAALEKDHEFLLQGDVFSRDLIETWVEMKKKEVDAIRLRPHPYEFVLYYDA